MALAFLHDSQAKFKARAPVPVRAHDSTLT